ncbi:sulfatase-like hydrolase/transferase [Paenibacillus sp. GXUN7292]|uniref:sulfatase-like hydrolase/transferase n=1 Tax=Paenibacillus sp. GXUN7292 TaxID=3422499 RepID=UPI003D7EDF20
MDIQWSKQLTFLKLLRSEIQDSIINNHLEQAENKIKEYSTYLNDSDFYNFKATYHFKKGELKEALATLLEGVKKHPFNYVINFNLGLICEENKDFMSGMKYYVYAAKYSRNKEESSASIESFNRIVQILANSTISGESIKLKIEECKKLLQAADARVYPLDENQDSLVRVVRRKDTKNEFMINMYKTNSIVDVNTSTRLLFKTELFNGKENKSVMEYELKVPSLVPISLIDTLTKVDFYLNDHKYQFSEEHFAINKFYYLRFNDPGVLKIVANKPMFVGNPISMIDKPKNPRLVMKIFIDGLSQKFLEQKGIEDLMPNTYSFFKEGFVSNNCYATSEWTLPSKASINTGRYPTNHKLLHPEFDFDFNSDITMMSEYLKENGYFTSYICNNWRTTPTFGYYKGFDRIVYKNFIGGMDCREVIMEAIEHIESFHEKNQYLAISFMDLHDVPDEIENNLYSQARTDIINRLNSNNKGKTSVLTKYDENKLIKYREEIKRLDFFLGLLFDFINKRYTNEEVLIVMHSDHGQTFLEPSNSILHDSRRKIPVMMKGQGVPNLVSDEIMESVDILPIILNCCGIELPNNIDGKLPKCLGGENERNFAITHVIHPNQPYRAAISDKDHDFQLETIENVANDLSIKIERYTVKLLNKHTFENESEVNREKVEFYEKVVFEHIKDFISWESNDEVK